MKDLRKAAAETTQAAAERGADLVHEAIARLQPLVEQAGEKVGPLAHEAKVRTADFASKTLDQLQPTLNEALDKVTPAVDAARTKVQTDLLPKLQELLHEAAEHPAVVAAVEPLTVEKPRKKSKLKTAAKVIAVGALLAGAAAAIKQFLSSKDDGWTAHEPSRAYINTTDNFAEAQAAEEEAEEAAKDMVDEGSPVSADSPESESTDPNYGDGAYVGDEPPAGFIIKGNERSMKYHMPGTGGFERTIPDVWFNSEDAAQAAGFVRAQR